MHGSVLTVVRPDSPRQWQWEPAGQPLTIANEWSLKVGLPEQCLQTSSRLLRTRIGAGTKLPAHVFIFNPDHSRSAMASLVVIDEIYTEYSLPASVTTLIFSLVSISTDANRHYEKKILHILCGKIQFLWSSASRWSLCRDLNLYPRRLLIGPTQFIH